MKELVTQQIVIALVLTTTPPIIHMKTDDEEYMMLTVKAGPLADALVRELETSYGVETPQLGTAFNYTASIERSRLVTYPVARAVGIYIRLADFDKVRFAFNK